MRAIERNTRFKHVAILVDGTSNDRDNEALTNIALISQNVPNHMNQGIHYFPGVGSNEKPDGVADWFQWLTGYGSQWILKDVFKALLRESQDGRPLRLYAEGFSRGGALVHHLSVLLESNVAESNAILESIAAESPELSNQIYQRKKAIEGLAEPKLADFFNIEKANKNHQLGAAEFPIKPNGHWHILVREDDPVFQMAFQDKWLTRPTKYIDTIVEAAATETRTAFPLNLLPRVGNTITRWWIGDHSDVGGGHRIQPGEKRLADHTLNASLSDMALLGFDVDYAFANALSMRTRTDKPEEEQTSFAKKYGKPHFVSYTPNGWLPAWLLSLYEWTGFGITRAYRKAVVLAADLKTREKQPLYLSHTAVGALKHQLVTDDGAQQSMEQLRKMLDPAKPFLVSNPVHEHPYNRHREEVMLGNTELMPAAAESVGSSEGIKNRPGGGAAAQ